MRRPFTAVAGCLLAGLLSSCSTSPPEIAVGSVVVHWDESNDELTGFDTRSDAQLISTEAQWQDWLDALPAEMREVRSDAIEKVDLEDSVLLVAVWDRCQEVGKVVDIGGGAVQFRINNPDPRTACAWSPTQVQVWDLPLFQLGVERGEVHLAP